MNDDVPIAEQHIFWTDSFGRYIYCYLLRIWMLNFIFVSAIVEKKMLSLQIFMKRIRVDWNQNEIMTH